MPRLLPPDALDTPSTKARWAVALAAACALTSWHPAWTDAYDTARSLLPETGQTRTWDARAVATAPTATEATELLEELIGPARAQTRTLTVPAEDITIDLAWQAPLTISQIRIKTYTDAHGTGHRLGIAAQTTTAETTGCLSAHLTSPEGTTTLQTCTRIDQHPPVDTAAFLGKDDEERWRPDRLFVTQTANLNPANYGTTTQIDYYGFGVDTGDAFETGLWPTGFRAQTGAQQHCENPHLRLRLPDLHLSDRYDDPAEHRSFNHQTLTTDEPARPEEHRLISQACVPVGHDLLGRMTALGPFKTDDTAPLSGWTPYNATTDQAQPIRTALVADLRSCDTTLDRCTNTDLTGSDHRGPGRTWMGELLGLD